MDSNALIRSTRPGPPEAWTASAQAEQILAGVLAHDVVPTGRMSRLKRPLIVGAAGAAVLVGAGAATWVALAPPAPPTWSPPSGAGVACSVPDQQDMAVVHQRENESPVDACRREWQHAFGQPAPDKLYACVPKVTTPITPGVGPSAGDAYGAVVVFPAAGHSSAAETCGAAHMFVAPGN